MTSLHEREIEYVYNLKFKIEKVENYRNLQNFKIYKISAGLGYNFKTTKLIFAKIFIYCSIFSSNQLTPRRILPPRRPFGSLYSLNESYQRLVLRRSTLETPNQQSFTVLCCVLVLCCIVLCRK